MKTIRLLNDESRPATLMLHNTAPTKVTPREPEAVAGCNCDRWGHPCPDCPGQKSETAPRALSQEAR